MSEIPAETTGGVAAATTTAATGGGRTLAIATGKNTGTARPTYNKEDIKTYETPQIKHNNRNYNNSNNKHNNNKKQIIMS